MLVKILNKLVSFFPTLDELAEIMAPDCMGNAFEKQYKSKKCEEGMSKIKIQ